VSERQSHKEEEREWNGEGPIAQEDRGRAVLGYLYRGPEFLVMPLMGRSGRSA